MTEYRRLQENLERISGTKLTEQALSESSEIYNENRRLTRQLYDERSRNPYLIRTSELYALVRAGNFFPVEQHTDLLRQTVDDLPARMGKQRDSIRVVIEGSFCEQPPLDLIKILEEAGCYIVDDDFVLGPRWFFQDWQSTAIRCVRWPMVIRTLPSIRQCIMISASHGTKV